MINKESSIHSDEQLNKTKYKFYLIMIKICSGDKKVSTIYTFQFSNTRDHMLKSQHS